MANEFKVRKGLIVQGSGSIILDIQGSQGELFSVTDSLSGSLFSVNDISGIPIMEVFSDNTIKMGTFNQEAIIVSGSRTGMGIATPQAELHISGASNDSLFRIQSPTVSSIVFVTGSGNVGIGTATPTNTLNVSGTTLLQGGQTTVRGSGTTSATTALRVENSSATARLTILDDGTSAFNTSHLYVSSSGRVAVGTLTPQRLFDVYNGSTSGIVASFGAQISNNNFSGISFGYVEQANASFRKSALVFERTETQGGGTNASGKIHFLLNNNSGTSATALTDAVLTIDSVGTTVGSSRVGIGTRFPTASLHISGTVVTDNLMRVQSTTGAEYFFISASGNVGIGTGTPTNTLQVVGGITATSLTASIISASSGITGSLFGTASWAQSASNAINSQTASFLPAGTYSITSSWAINARTSSNIFPAITNNTSSYVLTATGDGIINGNSNLTFNGSDVTLGSSGGRINLPVNGYIFGGDAAILNGNHVLFPANPPAQPNDILAGTSSLLASSTQIQLRSTSEPSVVGGYNSGSIFFKTPSGSGMTYTNEGRLGIGVSNPTNTLQIQGNVSASSYTGSLFGTSSWAQSASNAINSQTASFLPVGTYQITSSWAQSASNAINSQTASFLPIGTYQITSSWAQSASQALTASFLNGAFLQNGNSFGTTAILGTNDNQNLQLETSGSVRMTISSSGNVGIGMTTPSFRLDVSGSARFGTGSVGFASGLGQIHAVDRTGAYITATQTTSSIVTFMGADGTLTGMVGTYSSHDFVIRSNNSDKITLSAGGQVGIQTSPSEWIHLASDPPGGKYLQIDALQASNAPPYTSPPSFIENIVGPGGDGAVLGLPDYWMEIKLNGTIVLIPCYLPA